MRDQQIERSPRQWRHFFEAIIATGQHRSLSALCSDRVGSCEDDDLGTMLHRKRAPERGLVIMERGYYGRLQ